MRRREVTQELNETNKTKRYQKARRKGIQRENFLLVLHWMSSSSSTAGNKEASEEGSKPWKEGER